MEPRLRFHSAQTALLTRRRAQRGRPTLGDEADQDLALALAALSPEEAGSAREGGLRLGSDVYSRRYHETALADGLALLSRLLSESGLGALHVEHAFHRSARVRFQATPALAGADTAIRGAFVEGVLRGFLSHAFNCEALAGTLAPDTHQVELGEGRDVNHRRRSAA